MKCPEKPTSIIWNYIEVEILTDLKNDINVLISALSDKKGLDIKALQVGEVSIISDYFIIVTGTNTSQLDALRDIAEEKMKDMDYKLKNREGRSEGGWILLDYGTVIIHIFSEEMREFYDLDYTWRDVPQLAY
jgi:ribosome-associated protein